MHKYTKRYSEFTRDMSSHKARDSIHKTFYFAKTFLRRDHETNKCSIVTSTTPVKSKLAIPNGINYNNITL